MKSSEPQSYADPKPGSNTKKRYRSPAAKEKRRLNRNRRKNASVIGGEAAKRLKEARWLRRNLSGAEVVALKSTSLIEEGNIAKSRFWMGGRPPEQAAVEINRLWDSGEIKKVLKDFLPLPYRSDFLNHDASLYKN